MSEPQPPYGPPPQYGWTKGEPDTTQPFAPPSAPPAGYGAPAGYGPPAQQGPPAAWGGAPYGPGQAQETSGKAIVALVLAIGSFFVLPLLAAIGGLVVASSASREIDASGGRLAGRGMVTAAKVLSWINIALCLAAVALMVLAFGLFAVGMSNTP